MPVARGCGHELEQAHRVRSAATHCDQQPAHVCATCIVARRAGRYPASLRVLEQRVTGGITYLAPDPVPGDGTP